MKTHFNKFQSIKEKFCIVNYNQDNYSIGGGLDDSKFASRRHEDAKDDCGKLTLGEATQLFKKASGLEVDRVKEIIEFQFSNLEWHHAGKLPKQYGGGMKKTYFINASQMCELAENWAKIVEAFEASKIAEQKVNDEKKSLAERKKQFLKENATWVSRVSVSGKPLFFHEEFSEMNGKFGWFESNPYRYKLPIYYSGWAFESEEKRQEYFKIG
ncbi:hypothetical protein I5M32_11185 [Pedobacter sp. SD-b]|uniref:Uncharacterized protein n=1 Tax=Pedobacter segetis TaxID=2793069 RepID=A0ABS1BKV0_9SPHI|nr:hypothetical protein [Pedobacter segetis]MBK0383520.1 hypothetical protein [Pedobacter segetis]